MKGGKTWVAGVVCPEVERPLVCFKMGTTSEYLIDGEGEKPVKRKRWKI